MASEAFAGSQAVDTTEWSCPRDASFDSAQPQTADGVYQIHMDVSDMVGADELQVKVYEKVLSTGTQRLAFPAITLVGPQSSSLWIPSVILLHGWDVTLKQIAGTAGINVNWSIRKGT